MTTADLSQIVATMQAFAGANLTATLARLEGAVQARTIASLDTFFDEHRVHGDVLSAAAAMKQIAGQINVVIHALGILLCLPHLLEPDEAVEYVSLGAGNTGRAFDLETDRRIAEFKFINWRGGPESIRQNGLFKDFFQLAVADTTKRKYLYVVGTEQPLKFFRGGRAMGSVLSKNDKVNSDFRALYGDRYAQVREYYRDHGDAVEIVDVSPWLPELVGVLRDEGL